MFDVCCMSLYWFCILASRIVERQGKESTTGELNPAHFTLTFHNTHFSKHCPLAWVSPEAGLLTSQTARIDSQDVHNPLSLIMKPCEMFQCLCKPPEPWSLQLPSCSRIQLWELFDCLTCCACSVQFQAMSLHWARSRTVACRFVHLSQSTLLTVSLTRDQTYFTTSWYLWWLWSS